MSKGRPDSQPHCHRRDFVAIVAALVMGFLSLTKAWLFFLTGPALLVAIPLLFGVRSRAERLRALGKSSPATSRLATAQLTGLLVAYVCVPGYGDTSEVLLFGFLWIDLKSPLVTAMWYLSVLGAVVAVISSIAFFRLWRKTQTV
jgi:hypothetical protein